jgi:hypothetical protein
MIFPRSPIAGYMEIVPVDVMIKSAASPKTLQTHLIRSASDAAVVEFIIVATSLYRMPMIHHKPCRVGVSKSQASEAGLPH